MIVEVPLAFGSAICFPRNISHTFLPSDVGLSTLNVTSSYIKPQTKGFSYPSLYNFDNATLMSFDDYQISLKQIPKKICN